jgi:hypothetical protein
MAEWPLVPPNGVAFLKGLSYGYRKTKISPHFIKIEEDQV